MLVLCGNKIDLQEERKVSTLQGEEVAKKEGMVFCETSAKSGDGVSYMVYSCVARLALVEQVNDGGIEKVVEELEEGNKNKEQSSKRIKIARDKTIWIARLDENIELTKF